MTSFEVYSTRGISDKWPTDYLVRLTEMTKGDSQYSFAKHQKKLYAPTWCKLSFTIVQFICFKLFYSIFSVYFNAIINSSGRKIYLYKRTFLK